MILIWQHRIFDSIGYLCYSSLNLKSDCFQIPIKIRFHCWIITMIIILKGTEPKEAYLSNDHYVVNFALAVIGHFDFVHDWEKMKVNIHRLFICTIRYYNHIFSFCCLPFWELFFDCVDINLIMYVYW
jgi:hypothetical protein